MGTVVLTINDLLDSPETLADEIRSISAARPNLVILISEGPSDARTYQKVFSDTHVIPAAEVKENSHGRSAVMHIVNQIKSESWAKKIRGLVDRDLDIDSPTEHDGILYTDTADLEMYAFSDQGFYLFLEENTVIDNAQTYMNVCKKIYSLCAPLGAARVAGHRKQIKVPHDRFNFLKSGTKQHVRNICASDCDLLKETVDVLYRLDHNLESQLPDLEETTRKILEGVEKSVFVNKNSFAPSFIRVCKDNKLVRGSASQYTEESLDYIARSYLKTHPQCARNGGLYQAIQAI